MLAIRYEVTRSIGRMNISSYSSKLYGRAVHIFAKQVQQNFSKQQNQHQETVYDKFSRFIRKHTHTALFPFQVFHLFALVNLLSMNQLTQAAVLLRNWAEFFKTHWDYYQSHHLPGINIDVIQWPLSICISVCTTTQCSQH